MRKFGIVHVAAAARPHGMRMRDLCATATGAGVRSLRRWVPSLRRRRRLACLPISSLIVTVARLLNLPDRRVSRRIHLLRSIMIVSLHIIPSPFGAIHKRAPRPPTNVVCM